MVRRQPRSTRTDTLFPYTTLFRSTKALLTIDDLILNAVSPIYLAPVEFWNVIIAKNGVHQQLLLLAGPCRGALIIGRWINAVLHLADRRDRKRLLFHFHESCSPPCAQRLA